MEDFTELDQKDERQALIFTLKFKGRQAVLQTFAQLLGILQSFSRHSIHQK